MPKVSAEDRMFVNISNLSAIFGVSNTKMAKLVDEGLPVAEKPGPQGGKLFDLRRVWRWHSQRIRNESARAQDAGVGNLDFERARQAKASADKTELDNAERRGELVRADVLYEPVLELCETWRGFCDALPVQLKQHMPDMPASSLDMIRRELAHVRNAIAEVGEKYVDDDFGGKQ